jgi:DNA-binding XRE family transcriptional regulator
MNQAPKPAQIRELRETYGLSQADAADVVYSALRSWQNWEAGEVRMHPAIWAWFKHIVTTTQQSAFETALPRSALEPSLAPKPVKYVRQAIQFWWNARDNSIHVTAPHGTAPKLHTTFINDPNSERWHKSMFAWLARMLDKQGKPAPRIEK